MSIENIDKCFGPDAYDQIDQCIDLKPNFDYYQNHDFHKFIRNIPRKNKNIFSLLYSNICSLMHNFEELESLLFDLGEYKFNVKALSETWNPEIKSNTFRAGILEGYHKYVGSMGHTLKGGCGLSSIK